MKQAAPRSRTTSTLRTLAITGYTAGVAIDHLQIAIREGKTLGTHALRGYLTARWRVVSDVALVFAFALWIMAVNNIDVQAIGIHGLPTALPLIWFVAVALVLVSAGSLLTEEEPSRWRLGLHLVMLLVILYGTPAVIYSAPRYSWLYKHIGVTQYITTHGALNPNIDIYQNWPGFFAFAAWFDKVAGFLNPLSYAGWAQLGFEILYALELGWALKATPLTQRERWLALFLFSSANWIAQDYFSPQGLGLALSLGVFAIALHTLQPGTRSTGVRILEEIGRRIIVWPTIHILKRSAPVDRPREPVDLEAPTPAMLICLMLVYFVLTAVHELSPYIVVVQLGLLAIFGALKPRLAVVGMLAIAFGYLAPRFAYVNKNYGIINSFSNFFGNAKPPSASYGSVNPAEKITQDAGRLLSLWIWGLCMLGIVRRLRNRRSALELALLTFSPILLLALVAYGNEGVLRIFLFSLPWASALAATAVCVAPRRHRDLRWLIPPAMLAVTAGLFTFAFFGDDGSNKISAQDVKAATFLYGKTAPGPIMSVDSNFPGALTSRYPLYQYQFNLLAGSIPNTPKFGPKSVAFSTRILRSYGGGTVVPGYVVVSTSMIGYAESFDLATPQTFQDFAKAMDKDKAYKVIYRSGGTTIYELPPVAPGTQ